MREIHTNPASNTSRNGRMNFTVVSISDVPAPPASSHANDDRPLVLVVGDETAIADSVSEILNQNGYAAMTAYDGEDALETALLIRPELVITDVGTPGMNGIQVAAVLKKELPDCKVLLLSGQDADAEPLAMATYAGHEFALVEKPVQATELLARVSATIKAK
jgi:DNA-binding response OmpR family regulator